MCVCVCVCVRARARVLLLLLFCACLRAVCVVDEWPGTHSETEFCADPPNCTVAIPFKPQRCTGGHPVGVPGVVAATARALAERGTFTLARALAPAIAAARGGFLMYARDLRPYAFRCASPHAGTRTCTT